MFLILLIIALAISPAAFAAGMDDATGNAPGQAPVMLDPPRALGPHVPQGSAPGAPAQPALRSSPQSAGSAGFQPAPTKQPRQEPGGSVAAGNPVVPLPGATGAPSQTRIQPFESPEKTEPGAGAGKSTQDPLPAGVPGVPAVRPASRTAPAPEAGAEKQPCEVFLRITVPHNTHPVDSMTAYPYPVKPPKMFKPVDPMGTEPKDIKRTMINAGYTSRPSTNQPYPAAGWRFQNVLNAAIRRSGRGVPHTFLGLYPWLNSMVPYMIPEIERANKIEEERKRHYDAANEEYDKKYYEIQNESTRNGLYTMNVRFYGSGKGYVRLPAGTWWLAGSRKVPGLYYYWQVPVTLAPGGKETIELTEDNALLIQGGW